MPRPKTIREAFESPKLMQRMLEGVRESGIRNIKRAIMVRAADNPRAAKAIAADLKTRVNVAKGKVTFRFTKPWAEHKKALTEKRREVTTEPSIPGGDEVTRWAVQTTAPKELQMDHFLTAGIKDVRKEMGSIIGKAIKETFR